MVNYQRVKPCKNHGTSHESQACTANIGGAIATLAGAASFMAEVGVNFMRKFPDVVVNTIGNDRKTIGKWWFNGMLPSDNST